MPVLSRSETSTLLCLLDPDSSFERLAQHFCSGFAPEHRFRGCCGASLFLEDNELLRLPQRLALWYILWDVCKAHKIEHNPFISLFIKAAAGDGHAAQERCLLLQLLRGSGLATLAKQTPEGYCVTADLQLLAGAPSIHDLEQEYMPGGAVRQVVTNAFSAAAASRLLPLHPEAQGHVPGAAAQPPLPPQQQVALASALASRSRLGGFEPAWQRPRPAVLTPGPQELGWLGVQLQQGLVWDSSLGEDSGQLQAIRALVFKALSGPLLPAQQQQVLAALDQDPQFVYRLGIAAPQLPALVEHTPVIAYELLVRLMQQGGTQGAAGEYLSVLARMELSLHSMEVVNRLTTVVALPTEFVHLYITNCISSCESISDKYLQNRLVRLVCVFLQSLIRNRIINIRDLLHEVQAFCINFSRIREAAGLFRLLKQMEAGVAAGGGTGGLGVEDEAPAGV